MQLLFYHVYIKSIKLILERAFTAATLRVVPPHFIRQLTLLLMMMGHVMEDGLEYHGVPGSSITLILFIRLGD